MTAANHSSRTTQTLATATRARWARYAGALLSSSLLLACTATTSGDEELVSEAEALGAELEADEGDALVANRSQSRKQRTIGDQAVTFIKHYDADGEAHERILDEDGNEISADALPVAGPRRLGASLQGLLDSTTQWDKVVDVRVGLRSLAAPVAEPLESGSVVATTDGRPLLMLNGEPVAAADMRANARARQQRFDAQVARITEARRDALRELAARHPELAASPNMRSAISRGDASVVVPMELGAVESFARDHEDLVAGVELDSELTTTIASAIQDTNIDPVALANPIRQGGGVGVYMSETGCPLAGFLPSYTPLSGVPTSHSSNVSAIIRGASPLAHIYCRGGFTLPSAADLLGTAGNPRVFVETHSWTETLSDAPGFRLRDRDFDDHIYDTGVATFVASANFGAPSAQFPAAQGYTGSPAKGLNVISVGNYVGNTDTINALSSFRDSEIGNNKPEIVAPGTNINAGGFTMSGTSMASPHAAGFAADLMGEYTWLQLRPYYFKANMLAGADKTILGGTDKVGVGGLNFHRNYFNHTNTWWEGDNNSFDFHDGNDYLPNNGYVDREVYLDAAHASVRVALSWLNRGTYTYDHRADPHAIGTDLDLCVYDPNGVQVGCSSSWDNPFELVEFDPVISGNYRVRINRYANRDTASKLHMGVSINWN
ncbi:MAG: S8 family serine peptidase [Myxococcota bacterium]